MKVLTILLMLILSSSCSSDNSNNSLSVNDNNGEFKLVLSDGTGFTNQSKRFKVKHIGHNMWALSSLSWAVRFSADNLSESVPSSSTNLIYNNTYLILYRDIKGKRTRISCRPDRDPVGKINVTSINEKTVSGKFEFTLVKCRNAYTSENISEIKTPFIAKGYFNDMTQIDELKGLLKHLK